MKILILINEDWYFVSHKIPLATAALEAGHEVYVACRFQSHKKYIQEKGLKTIDLPIKREGKNPLYDVYILLKIIQILVQVQPDVLHNFTIKPVILGTLASLLISKRNVVNSLSGLGLLFSSRSIAARAVKKIVSGLLKFLFSRKGVKVIVQNKNDRDQILSLGITRPERVFLIRGSGVDPAIFKPTEPKNSVNLSILFASRLLKDKGIIEFIEAGKILQEKFCNLVFRIIGKIDTQNPTAISEEILSHYAENGTIEWAGYREDMLAEINNSDIVCLPTYYGEGIPKILIEAASCSKPIVATQWPGCDEIVIDGMNGLLVPPKSSIALAEALSELISDKDKRTRFGRSGRYLVIREFALQKVINQTMAVYDSRL